MLQSIFHFCLPQVLSAQFTKHWSTNQTNKYKAEIFCKLNNEAKQLNKHLSYQHNLQLLSEQLKCALLQLCLSHSLRHYLLWTTESFLERRRLWLNNARLLLHKWMFCLHKVRFCSKFVSWRRQLRMLHRLVVLRAKRWIAWLESWACMHLASSEGFERLEELASLTL